jgi:hypothetical protein
MNGAVANVLNSVLGAWVDNINSDQLKLSIFSGEVVLKDLKLKESAIESLGFPFNLQSGRISSLKVDIPWSKLSSAPLQIEISDIFGLISPSLPTSWSEAKEKEKVKTFKKTLLDNYEALTSSELSISEEKGFVEKLVQKLILNVQVRIKRIYLRFSDSITSSSPFSAGLYIGSLEAVTTNSSWTPQYIESADINYKKASLSNFYLFLDEGPEAESFEEVLQKEIEGKIDHSYILEPSNYELKARLNLNPKKNSENLYDFELDNKKIILGVDCFQLKHVMKILEYLDAFAHFSKGIERTLQEPDLPEDEALKYREKYKIYRVVMKSNQKKGKREKDELEIIEQQFNVYSLIQNRKVADKQLELLRKQESIKEEIKKTEAENTQGTLSKLSSFFWGKSDDKKKENDEKKNKKIEDMNQKLQEILQEQEKLAEEMNQLVGKSEEFQKFPKDFVLYSISLCFHKTVFNLKDSNKTLILFKMNELKVITGIRESSLCCKLGIKNTKIKDFIHPGSHSKYLMMGSSLAAEYEDLENAIFHLKSGGFELFCNFSTIFQVKDSLLSVFSDTSSQLTAGFMSQMSSTTSEYIESGQKFMKEFLEGKSQSSLQLFIDIKAPVIFLPLDPKASSQTLMVVDVGHLLGKTSSAKEEKFLFNVYNFELNQIRIAAVKDCPDHHKWKKMEIFDVLQETSFFLEGKMCTQVQYECPSIKVDVKFNHISFNVRNDILDLAVGLYSAVLAQIPELPEAAPKTQVETTETYKDQMKKLKHVIGIQFLLHIKSFALKVVENDSDLASFSVFSLQFSTNLLSDSSVISEIRINRLEFDDLRNSVLLSKVISNPILEEINDLPDCDQIKLNLLLKPKDDLLDLGIYVSDLRLVLEPSLFLSLSVYFSVPLSKLPSSSPKKDKKIAFMYSTKFNSRLVAQLSNFEVWLPSAAEVLTRRTGYFSMGAFLEYKSLEDYISYSNLDGEELSREYKSIQNEATFELTNLGGFVGIVNKNRVVLSEERTFDLLPPTRVGIEYKCLKQLQEKEEKEENEENEEKEEKENQVITSVSINLESIQVEIGFRDIQFFLKLSENWSKLATPEVSSEALSSAKSASSELTISGKTCMSLDCDSLRLTLLEDTGVKAYSLLYLHTSSLKLVSEMDSNTMQGQLSVFFYSDYFNLKLSAWEPLIEKWNLELEAVQTSAESPLSITAFSSSMLNVNVTMSMLETLGTLSRKLGENSSFWQQGTGRERALTDKNEILAHGQFFYSFENSLGLPISVWLHVPGAKVEDWKLAPGGSQLISYHQLKEKINQSSNKQGLNNGITEEVQAPISVCISVEGFQTVEGLFFEKLGIRGFSLENNERSFDCVLNVFPRDDLKVVRIETAVTCINNLYIPIVLTYGSGQIELESGKAIPLPLKWLASAEKPTVLAKGNSVPLLESRLFELISSDWAVQTVRKYKTLTKVPQVLVVFDPPLQIENLLPGVLSVFFNKAETPAAILAPGALVNLFKNNSDQVREVMIKAEFLNDNDEKMVIESQWTPFSPQGFYLNIAGNFSGRSIRADVSNLIIKKNKNFDLSDRRKVEEELREVGKKIEFFSPFILVNKTELPIELLDGKVSVFCRPKSLAFLKKPKMKLRVTKEMYGEASEFSKDINLEAVGITGCVVVPFKKQTETTPKEYLIGVTVVSPTVPLIRSRTIILAPRFLVTNQLAFPLFIRQCFGEDHGGVTEVIQPCETKTYNLENSELSRNVQVSRDGEDWSSPFSLQNMEDFQIKFKANKEDPEGPSWHFPSKLNAFHHAARVCVTTEDQSTLQTLITVPAYPEFRVNNLTQDSFSIRQGKYQKLKVPPLSKVDWVFNDLTRPKVLLLSSSGKVIEINIDRVKKAKKFNKYRLEVRVDGPVRELVISLTRGSLEGDFSVIEPKAKWKVSFDFCGVGVSVIDSTPAELFYISAIEIRGKFKEKVGFDKKRTKRMRKYYLTVGNIQVDNMQAKGKLFPMIFGCSVFDNKVPIVQIEVDKVSYQKFLGDGKYEKDSIDRFSWVELLIQELKLNIDQVVIDSVLEFASRASESLNFNSPFHPPPGKPLTFSLISPYLSVNLNPVNSLEVQQSLKSYFKLLRFSAIKIIISFRKSSKNLSPNLDPRSGFGLLGVASAIGGAFANISDSPLYFKELLIQESFQTISLIISQVMKNYTRQGILQAYKILGSSDLLGNPVGLIDKLGTGVLEFINEPVKGVIKGPKAFAEGVSKGVRSLVGNIVAGSFGSISKITGNLYGLVREVGGDTHGAERLNDSDNAFDNFYQGIKGGVLELAEGVTGIFTKPWKGAKKGGAKGLLKGIGSGLLGVFTSPLSAALRIGSGISTGVTNAATFLTKGKVTQMGRIRFPRHFSPLEVLEPYNWEVAEAKDFLCRVDDLRKEQIVFYMRIDEEEILIIIVTLNFFLFFINAELSKQFKLTKVNSLEVHKPQNELFYLRLATVDGEMLVISNENYSPLLKLYAAITSMISPTVPLKNAKKIHAPGRYGNSCCKPKKNKNVSKYSLSARGK